MNEMEISLGKEAIIWVNKTLTQGKTLAKYLLESLELSAGRVITFLPPEANIERAKTEFEWSVMPLAPKSEWVWLEKTPDGKEPVAIPVHTTDQPQITIIQEFLKDNDKHLCIFEDMMMCSTDRLASKQTHPVWTYGKEVYHVVFGGKTCSVDELRKVIRSSSSAWQHFIGIMTSWHNSVYDQPLRKEFTALELKTLAERTEKLLIGAYDNEGYLIWSKCHNE